jgi:hypothetical protein
MVGMVVARYCMVDPICNPGACQDTFTGIRPWLILSLVKEHNRPVRPSDYRACSRTVIPAGYAPDVKVLGRYFMGKETKGKKTYREAQTHHALHNTPPF